MSKLKTVSKRIVIFGAGKIGRSFIGQLFSRGGYDVVFIDIDTQLIKKLNEARAYKVLIKDEIEEEILVTNVRGVDGTSENDVIREIVNSSLLAVSVGKNALSKIVPLIARGLQMRFQQDENASAVDIILAENMRSAAKIVRRELEDYLPTSFVIENKIGLIETSIGKMVPIMNKKDLENDPLCLFAEAYNELILDKKGFQNEVPNIDGLAPKENINAWVDRKVFIHNLGHATAAYFGFFCHPDKRLMCEVLEYPEVLNFTRSVMMQSMEILLKLYPKDFTRNDLLLHIEDLLKRFRNRSLGDTLFRVGHDLKRKLGAGDRFMAVIGSAKKLNMPYDKILRAFCYGVFFKAKNEDGNFFLADTHFLEKWNINQEMVLQEICGFKDHLDQQNVMQIFNELT